MNDAHSADQEFCFSALRGVQAGKYYFSFICPLGLISTLFKFTDELTSPSMRSQRVLNKSRVPKIARYIVENPSSYVFSSIAASIDDAATRFIPFEGGSGDLGKLYVKMSSQFLINDGQHRRAAIAKAIEADPRLKSESISVVLFLDAGLANSQQIFADLNKNAIRPNKSINVLYDHRDDFSSMVVDIVNQIPVFKELVDLERTQISNRSRKLFTLNSIYDGTRKFLGQKRNVKDFDREESMQLSLKFWSQVVRQFPEWENALNDKISCKDLRDQTICASGLILAAMGIMGNRLMQESTSWLEDLENLSEIDWRRSNEDWEGVAIHNGKLSKKVEHVRETAELIFNSIKASEVNPAIKHLESSA